MSRGPETFAEEASDKEARTQGLRNPLGPADAHPRISADDPRNPFGREITQMPWALTHCVYVIFRPWRSCSRCLGKIKANALELPDEGDYVCPHTQIGDYNKLLNERSDGLCRFYETETTTLKDGTIIKSVGVARPKTKEDLEDSALRTKGVLRAPRL